MWGGGGGGRGEYLLENETLRDGQPDGISLPPSSAFSYQ